MNKESKTEPFALDLSEAQVLWDTHAQQFGLPREMSSVINLHGAFLDGFLHARGWRLDETKAPAIHNYKEERAYEVYPHPLNEMEEIRKILNTVYDAKTIVEAVRELRNRLHAATHALESISKVEVQPVPMLLWCPMCSGRHIDEGRFATHPHKDHACQSCGAVWRPALVATVGVRFLPGYKNE